MGDYSSVYMRDEDVVVEGVRNLKLQHIFECGQCFRWSEQDGNYTGVVGEKMLQVMQRGDNIVLKGTTMEEFKTFWSDYFDLNKDYSLIKKALKKDNIMERALKFGFGIRILQQDMWETLVSFIISANNRIPMIKRTIERLCSTYGSPVEKWGRTFFTFPTPERLACLSKEDLALCGCGYRSEYIIKTAKRVASSKFDLKSIKDMDYREARRTIMELPGVGPKVGDCILLFSGGKPEAFPIDIWIKRVMEYFYFPQGASMKRIYDFAMEYFGPLAGFAQQYLFYYARELGIGRK